MKEEWKEYKIRDIANIKYGKMPPKSIVAEEGYSIFSGYGITGYANIFNQEDSSIVIIARGVGGTGKVKLSPKKSWITNLCLILDTNKNLVDDYFLYRYLGIMDLKRKLDTGSAQSQITINSLAPFKVTLPPLSTQQKIANILSAYDDLIENNIKRIELLEEQAQLIYEEWFVRMKFPNHENTKIDAETGLPAGWEKKGLDYLCSKITDGTHDSPKQVNDGYYLVTGKHLNKGIIDFESAYQISIEDHEKIRKRSGIEKGDILFSNIGTLGNIGVVTEDFEYSCKNVVIFKKKNCFDSFLYCYLTNPINKIKLDNQSSGVAQKFYSLSFIRRFQDFFPKEPLIKKFDEIVQPIFELKYKLHQQNQILQEARDILLPRLMMGIIEV